MAFDETALEKVIQTRVKPLLSVDGGTVEVVSIEEDGETRTIGVRFGGAYRGSPCRKVVLDNVIVPIIKDIFGEGIRLEMMD
jgi:Fe-S cluster biogenesis protein NfuA